MIHWWIIPLNFKILSFLGLCFTLHYFLCTFINSFQVYSLLICSTHLKWSFPVQAVFSFLLLSVELSIELLLLCFLFVWGKQTLNLFIFLSERLSKAFTSNGCSQRCTGDIPTGSCLGRCCILLSELRMACQGKRTSPNY